MGSRFSFGFGVRVRVVRKGGVKGIGVFVGRGCGVKVFRCG